MVRTLRSRAVPSPHSVEKTAPKTTKKVTAAPKAASSKPKPQAKVTKTKAAPKKTTNKNTRSAAQSATPEVEDEPEQDEEREGEDEVQAQAVIDADEDEHDEETIVTAQSNTETEQKVEPPPAVFSPPSANPSPFSPNPSGIESSGYEASEQASRTASAQTPKRKGCASFGDKAGSPVASVKRMRSSSRIELARRYVLERKSFTTPYNTPPQIQDESSPLSALTGSTQDISWLASPSPSVPHLSLVGKGANIWSPSGLAPHRDAESAQETGTLTNRPEENLPSSSGPMQPPVSAQPEAVSPTNSSSPFGGFAVQETPMLTSTYSQTSSRATRSTRSKEAHQDDPKRESLTSAIAFLLRFKTKSAVSNACRITMEGGDEHVTLELDSRDIDSWIQGLTWVKRGTDETGKSHKRKTEGEESPAKRVCPPKATGGSNPFYNEYGDMAGPTEERRLRSLNNQTAPERRAAKPTGSLVKAAVQEALVTDNHEDAEASSEEEIDDEAEIDRNNEVEQQTDPEPGITMTPARSGWGASISGLFRTPMSLFRRSARSEPRGAIPTFASAATPSKASHSVSSSNKKQSPKKVSKAKRQAAIDHQTELEKRKAATEAIVNSARSVEEIEEEIERRVQEQIASMSKLSENASNSVQKKRKRDADSSEDGPGNTPHPKKPGPKQSLAEASTPVPSMTFNRDDGLAQPTIFQTPNRNAGFGLSYEDSPEEEERPAKRAKPSVTFKIKHESLTTPPQNSELARMQARRPPNSQWTAGEMFREPPKRGILKETGYVAPVQVRNEFDYMEPDKFEFNTPHNVRESIADDRFNFAGSFSMPELSDSEGEDSFLTDEAGSTPMPKKSQVFNFDSPSKSSGKLGSGIPKTSGPSTSAPSTPAISKTSGSSTPAVSKTPGTLASGMSITESSKTSGLSSSSTAKNAAELAAKVNQEVPPAAPQPAHATLPSSSPPSSQTKESPNSPLDAIRAKAQQHTPKQSSRLRESTNASTSPEPIILRNDGMPIVGSPMRTEVFKNDRKALKTLAPNVWAGADNSEKCPANVDSPDWRAAGKNHRFASQEVPLFDKPRDRPSEEVSRLILSTGPACFARNRGDETKAVVAMFKQWQQSRPSATGVQV